MNILPSNFKPQALPPTNAVTPNQDNKIKEWFPKLQDISEVYRMLGTDQIHPQIAKALSKFLATDLKVAESYKPLYFWLNELLSVNKPDNINANRMNMIPGTSVELTKINAENIKVTLTASKKYDFIISAKQYNLVIYFSGLAYVVSMGEDFLIKHHETGNYDWVRSLRSLNFFDFLIKSSNPRKLINHLWLLLSLDRVVMVITTHKLNISPR